MGAFKPKRSALLTSIILGLAGVIFHAIYFFYQSSPLTNTFIPSWHAGVCLTSGLLLLYTEIQPPYYLNQRRYRYPQLFFDILVILFTMCSMVCHGIIMDWFSFVWGGLALCPQIWTCHVHLGKAKREEYQEKGKKTVPKRRKIIISIVLSVLKGFFLLVVALLTCGSVMETFAYSYRNPGTFVNIMYDGTGNRTGNVALYCLGEKSNRSTIFFNSSPAHGIADFYGVQYYLTQKNRRVCTYDTLGFGHSGDPLEGQFTSSEYLMRLMADSGEAPPYHLVGMGGVPQLAETAARFPAFVKSATFIETYPDGVEFQYYGAENGLDANAIEKYRETELASRVGLVKLILSVAIPWGLMSLFAPLSPLDTTYYPSEKWTDFRVQIWKSNTWITQLEGLKYIQATPDKDQPLQKYAPLPNTVPVFGIYCDLGDTCFDGSQNQTGSTCTDLQRKNQFYAKAKYGMLRSLNENATVVNNTAFDCGIDLPVKKPEFTADAIISLISTIET